MYRLLAAGIVAVAVACSTGPTAPPVGASAVACAAAFCVEHPEGWVASASDGFVSLQHADVVDAIANASGLDPQGIVRAAGGTWPATPEEVVRSFWELLADGSGASVDDIEVLADGSVRSVGGFQDGRLWHRMVIADDGSAFGIEMRAPNSSWEGHADVLLDGLSPLP